MHSVAFQIGGLTIYWYGIFTAAGFLLAFWMAARRAPQDGIAPEVISNLAPWIIVGAVIGARLLYVISYWDEEFAGKPIWEAFMLRRSGLVYYGGFIGACLATIIYAWIKKVRLWKIADITAPSIALGHGIGRFGCLMTGCCYGKSCQLPWAIRFPSDHATKGAPVHPTQIYEALLNIGFSFFLMWLFRRKKFDGQVFAVYLLGYALLRSFVERFRGDYQIGYLSGLVTPGQLVSIGIFVTGVILWAALRKGNARAKVAEG